MRGILALVLVSGCSSLLGIDSFHLKGDGGAGSDTPTRDSSDGAIDSAIDANISDAFNGVCYGPVGWEVCVPTAPTNNVGITSSFDTGTSALCASPTPSSWAAQGHPDACIIIAQSFNQNDITPTGTRPLVLVASGSIIVKRINANAIDTAGGPGSDPNACPAFPVAPTSASSGGGGGAGASFRTQGGDGGNGPSTNGGGAAAASATPTKLRGGCSGQTGANGFGTTGGAGGFGGGAVYIIAGTSISLQNGINVSGGGGKGGTSSDGGGGGGGAGGMIMLYAPTITAMNSYLIADGGGGGGGGGLSAQPGNAGGNANTSTPTVPPAGGLGGGMGGTGGAAFAGGTAAVNGGAGMSNGGGGGGGGGGGYIRSNVAITNVTASPAIDIVP